MIKAIKHKHQQTIETPQRYLFQPVMKQTVGALLALTLISLVPSPTTPQKLAANWLINSLFCKVQSELTVAETIKLYGKQARSRLTPHFKNARIKYPPTKLTMLCLKKEELLILFAPDSNGDLKQIAGYPIIGTSGKAGPKLKEGDLQIPEGFYQVPGLYPNSIAHLGIRVNYPNIQDRKRAKADHRTKLGGDILIHGSYWSTGCLAMGNSAIEELYVLVNDVGCKNIDLTFAPCDLRKVKPDVDFKSQPKWLPQLYKELKEKLRTYPIAIDPSWKATAEKKPSSYD
jgi:hypothetical protein